MKKYIIIPIALLLSCGAFAQGLYNNGGQINIGPGATLYISGTGGHLRNESNGTDGAIKLEGNLKIEGNYTNNVSGADILVNPSAGSAVEFNGTAPQTLDGSTAVPFTFSNLVVNNNAGITLANTTSVTGNLALSAGLVTLGTSDLTLGATSAITGSPSAAAMVVATSSGELRKIFTGTGSFTFPVGDNNGTADYSPVTLDFLSGTFAPGAYAGISLANTAYTDPLINTSYLQRYWNVSQSGITSFSCNAAFNYLVSDVVGTEADITAIRINPTPAVFYDPANTTLHQLTASNLSSFGTFTGTLGFRTLSLKLYLEGLYIGAGTMSQASDGTGPHFGPGIADVLGLDLHNATTYSVIDYSLNDLQLHTDGTVTVPVPANYSGSYYLAVRHRNSIETVSGTPVSLGTTAVNYDFSTAASQAYMDNMIQMTDGKWAFYGGDENADGSVDVLDLIDIENDAFIANTGYISTDVNGDGVVDALDLILVGNNAFNAVSAKTP
jgi:hypothetical protein